MYTHALSIPEHVKPHTSFHLFREWLKQFSALFFSRIIVYSIVECADTITRDISLINSFLYHAKQKDAILPCVCSVKDHNRRRTVVRTWHSAIALCNPILDLPHFDVIWDQLLNRPTATWNLFVKVMAYQLPRFNRKKLQKCPIQKRQPCEPRPVADLSFCWMNVISVT